MYQLKKETPVSTGHNNYVKSLAREYTWRVSVTATKLWPQYQTR